MNPENSLAFLIQVIRSLVRIDFALVLFLKVVFVSRKGGKIYDQFRRMGASVDWDRACFTMDNVVIYRTSLISYNSFDRPLIIRP